MPMFLFKTKEGATLQLKLPGKGPRFSLTKTGKDEEMSEAHTAEESCCTADRLRQGKLRANA